MRHRILIVPAAQAQGETVPGRRQEEEKDSGGDEDQVAEKSLNRTCGKSPETAAVDGDVPCEKGDEGSQKSDAEKGCDGCCSLETDSQDDCRSARNLQARQKDDDGGNK